MKPEISVIIPAYNEKEGIVPVAAGIHGVMKTFGRPYEIIVVDDGSSDGTAEAARAAGASVILHP